MKLLRIFPLLSILLLAGQPAYAQSTRYINDEIFVALRSGPGTDYRWRGRLTPGTRLTLARTSKDGKWAEVTTARGTVGWVQTEYLTTEVPAAVRLPETLERVETLQRENRDLQQEVAAFEGEREQLLGRITDAEAALQQVTEELTQLRQVSGNAVQLDIDNRRLVEEAQDLRSSVEMLEAENQRLGDKLKSEDFINGALAVLLGVIITLVVPRLWPGRRRSSGWA